MRQCPLCSRLYDDVVEFCPLDNRVLYLPDPLLGVVLDGKYRLEALLGFGGQGAVYHATHLHLERRAAIKVIHIQFGRDAEATERFKREALTAARLKHPHIVTVHDFGITAEAGAYLVMEFLEGHSLHSEIRRRARLQPALAADLMLQICDALDTAHAHGVVHHDVKPENVFLETRPDGSFLAKVLDFGVAQMRRAPGVPAGTAAYMAPEQALGGGDARSDVYSLGCVLYEMLTGAPPFVYDGAAPLEARHATEPPEPPSTRASAVSGDLDAVLLQALAKRPEDRFPNARDLARAVAAAMPAPELSSRATGVHGLVRPPAAARGNLPQQMTSFIGREREIEGLRHLLSANRLITLTGPSGAGKTRLAIEVASGVAGSYPDGVWLVELASLSLPELVPQAIASVLGVREERGTPVAEALYEYVAPRSMLLLLDNCEHLVGACALLASALLRACPSLRVLATSQEALAILGEVTWPVPPLSLPAPCDDTPESLSRSDAARLFVDRAMASNPAFALTAENAPAVAQICRCLDGIPLALELAGARARVLSVEQIANRLDDRFRLLVGGDRTAHPRRRTLQAAIDWSYDLLGEAERAVFDRLSVFAGGCTLEAAEAVGAGGAVAPGDVLYVLSNLVDKSLLVVEQPTGEARYRLLETIRRYAAETLRQSGEAPRVRTQHRDHFLAFAQMADAELRGAGQVEWLDRLELEHDNLRAALEWSKVDASSSDAFLRLAGLLAKFWQIRGYTREGREWLEAALAASATAPSAARARALHGAGALAGALGDYARAKALHAESLEIWRALGDQLGVANALNHLGFIAQWQGDYDLAERLHDEGLAVAREARDVREEASALNSLGIVSHYRGDYQRAAELYETSLALFRATGDQREIAKALSNLGVVVATSGDYARAAGLFEEQLALRRAVGDRWGIATSLNNLGQVALLMNDYDRAAELIAEALQHYEEMGDRRGVAYSLESFVSLAVRQGCPARALRLAGASSALRAAIGAPLSPSEQSGLDDQLAAAKTALGEKTAAELHAGRLMTPEAAIAYALDRKE